MNKVSDQHILYLLFAKSLSKDKIQYLSFLDSLIADSTTSPHDIKLLKRIRNEYITEFSNIDTTRTNIDTTRTNLDKNYFFEFKDKNIYNRLSLEDKQDTFLSTLLNTKFDININYNNITDTDSYINTNVNTNTNNTEGIANVNKKYAFEDKQNNFNKNYAFEDKQNNFNKNYAFEDKQNTKNNIEFITGTSIKNMDDNNQQDYQSNKRNRNAITSRNTSNTGVMGKFNKPIYKSESNSNTAHININAARPNINKNKSSSVPNYVRKALEVDSNPNSLDIINDDPRLKNIDPKIIEMVSSEIIDRSPNIKWSDVIGLEFAKQTVLETIIWPMQKPELFCGLRAPARGILLFGPPGTGKTMIGKAIASEAYATFFSISAASLTSKWHGEGEKLVKALFGVAAVHQPAVIFIDEIDSLLCQRSDSDFEASRRSKTEFLINFDGLSSSKEEKILIVGATNRPQDLDDAARRRFVKRLYIPLPELESRKKLVTHLLRTEKSVLSEDETDQIAIRTEGYSGADLNVLCKDAALGPLRGVDIKSISNSDCVRPISFCDFETSLNIVKSSVSPQQLNVYEEWNRTFGTTMTPNITNNSASFQIEQLSTKN